MSVLKDNNNKFSMLRVAIIVIFIIVIIILVNVINMSYLIIKENKPEFIPLVLGFISIDGIGILGGLITKVIQKKYEKHST